MLQIFLNWNLFFTSHSLNFIEFKLGESESEVTQSCPTLCDPMDSSLHQAPPSMGFSRQAYWSGLPFPSPIYIKDDDYWLNYPKKIAYFLRIQTLESNCLDCIIIIQCKNCSSRCRLCYSKCGTLGPMHLYVFPPSLLDIFFIFIIKLMKR